MKIFVFFLCLLIVACDTHTPRKGFFPSKAFYYSRYDSRDQSVNEKIAKDLNERVAKYTGEVLALSFQEPSLYELSNNRDVHCYRFLWLRSFHRYVALRLVLEPNDTAQLVIKISDRTGTSSGVGRLIENKTQSVTEQQVKEFQARLEKAKFWTLPGYDGSLGLDGASWFIEGVKDGQYKMVTRWAPQDETYRAAGLFLLDLSGLQGEEIY